MSSYESTAEAKQVEYTGEEEKKEHSDRKAEACRDVHVRTRLSTEVTKLPAKVLCNVCVKLNCIDPRYRDFRLLAQKLGFSPDCINNLKQGTLEPNPTDILLRWWERDKGSKATVGNLIKILEHKDLGMTGAVQLLQNCSGSDVITEIELDVYRKLCWKLNIFHEESFKDFRMLGEKMGYNLDTTQFLAQNFLPTNPTRELLRLWHRDVGKKATVERLIALLSEEDLQRNDVVDILKDWVHQLKED